MLRYNNSLYGWARKGWITDLQAFAELCDYGASMIPVDISGDRTRMFVDDMGAVLTEFVDRAYYKKADRLQQSGFDWIFQDPGAGGEQPHHFWFYVYSVFQSGSRSIATFGNLAHETFLARGGRGRSYQDFALGQEAVNMGVDLYNGEMGIEDVGDHIRRTLSPGGESVHYYHGTLGGEFSKRFYALCLAVAGATFWKIPAGEQGGPAQ